MSGGSYSTHDVSFPTSATLSGSVTYPTQVNGINNSNQLAASWSPGGGSFGAPGPGSPFTASNGFGLPQTVAHGINDNGEVVGGWTDAIGNHGFLTNGSSVSPITVGMVTPGSNSNQPLNGITAFGINNSGQIVGTLSNTGNATTAGFLISGGTISYFEDPAGSPFNLTEAFGINNNGDIVGSYLSHGFILSGGVFNTINVPFSGALNTQVTGINDNGLLVGTYQTHDPSFGNLDHGFLATPVGMPVLPNLPCSGGFCFGVSVPGGVITPFDPMVAIGYDFLVSSGPLFRSVDLPSIGSSNYMLFLWDGSKFVFDQDLLAGTEFFLGPGGVDRFRILGIDTGAALDPSDPLAFQVGLSFVSGGDENFSMTPLTADVSGTVPEPSTWLLFGSGLAGLAAWRRKKAV